MPKSINPAALVFTLMTTWRTGRRLLRARLAEHATPLAGLLDELEAGRIARVPGTAGFLTGNSAAVPTALSQHLRHCPVLHERVIILNLRARDVAHLPVTERVSVEPLGAPGCPECWQATASSTTSTCRPC